MKIKFFLLTGFMFVASMLQAQTLKEQAQLKIDNLNRLITEAQNKGLEVQKERMSVRVAEIFLRWADWDAYNITSNTNYFKEVPRYAGNATAMAQLLPDFERTEVNLMLSAAINEINSLIAGDIVRKPTTNIDWERLEIDGSQIVLDGKPVFLSDYIWKPKTDELQEFFGQLDSYYISPSQVSNAAGDVSYSIISELQSKPTGKFGSIFLDHSTVPSWATTSYPGLLTGGRAYTKYDIDNPGARELQRSLLKKTVPLMAGKNYTKMGYMMCNEPHWHTAVDSHDTGPVSNYTKERFKTWLKDKHVSIANLNTLWGTNFSGFGNVDVTIPMAANLRGGAQWYDWMLFNMDRVTDWFTFVHDEIRKYDGNAKTHLKVMPSNWGYYDYDNGLDMEALMNLTEILGNDAGTAYVKRDGSPETGTDRYAFAWREMCPFYDFCRSVDPDKMMVNSETHFLSGFNFRDLYMTAEYTRAVTWLAAMLGQNAAQTWVWGRTVDGYINSSTGEGYAGSTLQQPRVLNEIEATTMDLNRYPEYIAAIQKLKKPLRIFYSKTSAINSSTYMNSLYSLYETFFFNGVPLGYATKNIIATQNNSNWSCIVVYQTPNVTQAERDALQTYITNGGTVIIDNESIKKDEYGRAISSLTAAGTGRLISATSLTYMNYQVMQLLENNNSTPDITITETNSLNTKACVWRTVKTGEGKYILSVINVGKTAATLDIALKTATNGIVCKDLLTGKTRNLPAVLQPLGVLYVEITDVNYSGITNLEKSVEFAKLYPTQVDNTLNIHIADFRDVELSIYDITGCVVKKEKYTNTKDISMPVSTLAGGMYIVNLTSKDLSQTLRFVKK